MRTRRKARRKEEKEEGKKGGEEGTQKGKRREKHSSKRVFNGNKTHWPKRAQREEASVTYMGSLPLASTGKPRDEWSQSFVFLSS